MPAHGPDDEGDAGVFDQLDPAVSALNIHPEWPDEDADLNPDEYESAGEEFVGDEYSGDEYPGDDDPGDEYLDDDDSLDGSLGALDTGGTRRGRPARRRRRWVGVLVLLVCLGLVGSAAWFGVAQVRAVVGSLTGTNDYPGPGSGEVTIVIKDGDSGRTIANTLAEAGVVKSPTAFVDALRASGSANAMQPGTYTLKKQMSGEGALALLQNPTARINIQVRIREGLWKAEVYQAIGEQTGFTAKQLDAAAADPSVPLPVEAKGNPEGYLFPATYTFEPDVTPLEVITQMVVKYNEEMATANVPAASQRHVLIVASLVQAEASNPDDFAKVARVVENRVAKGQKLEFDTTVNFAIQKRGFDLTKADIDTASPYNTRRNVGLPPGPINSPGAAAIEAAAHPAAGDWLYFVTVNPDTGETLFTSDYNEFLRGKEQFTTWYQNNKKSQTP